MSNSKPIQLNLFDFTEVDKADKERRWVYATDGRNERMIVMDDKGRFCWTPCDLQHVIPFLFPSRYKAYKVLRGFTATRPIIRVYPYEHDWWKK